MEDAKDKLAQAKKSLAEKDAGRAARLLKEILEHAPNHAEALNLSGVVSFQRGDLQRADDLFARALKADPGCPGALSNRANVLNRLDRPGEALALYDEALLPNPEHSETLCNRAIVLHRLGRYEEALAGFDKALALRPDFAQAHSNRGLTLQQTGRPQEALASFNRALSLMPDYPFARWNASLCKLLLGDFAAGWPEYEWRWKQPEWRTEGERFKGPRWLGGESLAGKTILLHAEQGLGDTLQFCRYAPAVAETGATVLLEVQSPLKELLSTLGGIRQIFARGEALPPFDFHCPLMSLPLAFGTTLGTIPAAVPYIRADAVRARQWDEKIGRNGRPRVGIACSGRPTHRDDRNRSIPLRHFAPLLAQDLQLVSLQKDIRPEDRKMLEETPGILNFADDLKDFSDTAALAETMDLVITVDTSVAHLAGAMGKPVWILLPFAPDWRWLLNREDSPWYPSATLFRQSKTGEWDDVFGRIAANLASFIGNQRVKSGGGRH